MFELAALAYFIDMIFGEFPCKHPVVCAAMAGALGGALESDAYYHGQLKRKPGLGVSINPVNKAVLVQALAMKSGINLMVLGLLTTGIMFA